MIIGAIDCMANLEELIDMFFVCAVCVSGCLFLCQIDFTIREWAFQLWISCVEGWDICQRRYKCVCR